MSYEALSAEQVPSAPTVAAEWNRKLASILVEKKEEKSGGCCSASKEKTPNAERKAVAMQIHLLQDVDEGCKMYLLHIYDESQECLEKGTGYRKRSLDHDIAYGICAALVPILIPFSQTYKDTTLVFFGNLPIGTLISLFAVACSLISTVIHVWQNASKSKEQALLYAQQGEFTKQELFSFLAGADQEYDTSKIIAYKRFMMKYNRIRADYARFTLFKHAADGKLGKIGGSENAGPSSQVMPDKS